MPKLRDYFASDLPTFFNRDEFSVKAIIEGEEVDVVLDSDKLKERQMKNHVEGLVTEELLFFVSKKALSFYPRSGNRVKVDDSQWKVKDVSEDEGVFTITVEWVSA